MNKCNKQRGTDKLSCKAAVEKVNYLSGKIIDGLNNCIGKKCNGNCSLSKKWNIL